MKRLKLWGAILIFMILLLKPAETIQNAQRAMGIWYSSVAPALFPFLALMPLLTSEEACRAYEVLFSKWMRPLFRLPGSAAPAIIAGMVAGSPGGAITLCRIARNSDLSGLEARRVALALGGLSPAYLITSVGQGLHGSTSHGLKLAAIQAGIQMFLLLILPNIGKDDKPKQESESQNKTNPIAMAVESVLSVCGYMVFYSVIAGAVANLLGKGFGVLLLPLMDLPSGLANLAASDFPFKMIIQGTMIGFTGLCIISQNMDALKSLNLKWKHYMTVRVASAAAFAVLSAALESDWGDHQVRMLCSFRKTYAGSLLIVGIIVIPGLILLSKKSFLNIRKNRRMT